MSERAFLHLDVFTADAFTGNPLAVFPDATGLDADQMQRIAAEMNFSESTFVFPPQRDDTDVAMRIFTPRQELPIAGHPTVGTTFALARQGVIRAPREQFVFGLGVGPTPVTLDWRGEQLAFAWMRQPVPEFGPVLDDQAAIAEALGIDVACIADSGLPVQSASCGVPVLFVPLDGRDAVDAAVLDATRMRAVLRDAGMDERAVFVFSTAPAADGVTAYSRMFAPLYGIAEDPATGGASGPLGCYLLKHGAVTREQATDMVSLQGVAMGRPSRIHIDVRQDDAGAFETVRVGGQAVQVGHGVLLDP